MEPRFLSHRTIWVLMAMFLLTSFRLPAQTFRKKIRDLLIRRIEGKALETAVKSEERTIQHGGLARSYYLYIPSRWDRKKKIPLVFLFHGGGGGARGALANYDFERKAEEAGFLLVAPNGTGEVKETLLTWNVSFGFGFAQSHGVDDLGFIRTLLENLEKEFPVDPDRIFATGISNGAILCHWLAAQPWNRLAAIAPVVGTFGGREAGEKEWHVPPKPATPVSVCIIQGLLDKHIPIGGGLQEKSVQAKKEVRSASDTVDFWVSANGCRDRSAPLLDPALKTMVMSHTCPGGNPEVRVYILQNQGHAWPGSKNVPRRGADRPSPVFPANDIIWSFFKAHPKAR